MHWHEGHDDRADQPALIDERDLATHIPPELLGDRDDELRPVDWNTLPADEAWGEWRDLNEWVDWIRKSHGLPATVIAPLWHRHDEMVWELSAQHLSFRASYHRRRPTHGSGRLAPRLLGRPAAAARDGGGLRHPHRP